MLSRYSRIRSARAHGYTRGLGGLMPGLPAPRANSQRSASRHLNAEPVLQGAGVNNGENSVNNGEVTCTWPKSQQGQSILSQVAAVNAISKNEWMRRSLESAYSMNEDGDHLKRWKQVLWSQWKAGFLRLAVRNDSFLREGLNVQ